MSGMYLNSARQTLENDSGDVEVCFGTGETGVENDEVKMLVRTCSI